MKMIFVNQNARNAIVATPLQRIPLITQLKTTLRIKQRNWEESRLQ